MPRPEGVIKVAIPSMGNGGLEDRCSPHFGRSENITVLEMDGKKVQKVEVVKNPGYESGHCIELIGILSTKGVDAILVGGMGRTAFKVCTDLGIRIFYGLTEGTIREALDKYLEGGLSPLTPDDICNKVMDRGR